LKVRFAAEEEARNITPDGRTIDETTPLKCPKDRTVTLLENPYKWVHQLSSSYSWKLLLMVTLTSHLLKGFLAGGGDDGLIGKPAEFLFGDLGVSAGRLQMLKAAAIVPWALKPVVALLSDAFPIFGYHKMPYVVITTIFSFCGVAALGSGMIVTEAAIVAALFVAFLQVATVDVLMSAKQSEEVKQKSSLGPDFISFTWIGINAGQLCSVFVLGPLISHMGTYAPYHIAAPIVLLMLWPALGNFLGEKRVAVEDAAGNFKIPLQHSVLCAMTLVIGLLALSMCSSLLWSLRST